MKRFIFSATIFSFILVCAKQMSAFDNPGDLGGSILGEHETLNCLYHITGQQTVTASISISGTPVPTASGSASGTTVYSGAIPGTADHCTGWWGFCAASGICQPK